MRHHPHLLVSLQPCLALLSHRPPWKERGDGADQTDQFALADQGPEQESSKVAKDVERAPAASTGCNVFISRLRYFELVAVCLICMCI